MDAPPHDFPMEQGHNVSFIKYGGKLFMTDWRQVVLDKFTRVLFYMEG